MVSNNGLYQDQDEPSSSRLQQIPVGAIPFDSSRAPVGSSGFQWSSSDYIKAPVASSSFQRVPFRLIPAGLLGPCELQWLPMDSIRLRQEAALLRKNNNVDSTLYGTKMYVSTNVC